MSEEKRRIRMETAFLKKVVLRETFFSFEIKISSFWNLQDSKIHLPNGPGVKAFTTYYVEKPTSYLWTTWVTIFPSLHQHCLYRSNTKNPINAFSAARGQLIRTTLRKTESIFAKDYHSAKPRLAPREKLLYPRYRSGIPQIMNSLVVSKETQKVSKK